ncbi:hypothetical protein LEP1GSC058_1750 [Leptospira fainei serovar Hurstbridge str. BUT 6]|uniref:Uncharacterized protein n=1 Tax=Leptospira fainei serovar Hurstbridge str. BUT 6 TaxID=1193011 RepID=S3V249_9LEPT|nr:hypothetical protein [Leptospira fainei]EPG74704.1 hypothetical protein LEP1GSC058_1750 [Leptospira fainei serovar Hurstbridge str. BUT 6]
MKYLKKNKALCLSRLEIFACLLLAVFFLNCGALLVTESETNKVAKNSSQTDTTLGLLGLSLSGNRPNGGTFSLANTPSGLISLTQSTYTVNYQIVAASVAASTNVTILIQKNCTALNVMDSFNFPGAAPTSNTYTVQYPQDFSNGSATISIYITNFGYIDSCNYSHTVSASNNTALPVGTGLGTATISYFNNG